MKNVLAERNRIAVQQEELAMPLHSMSPIAKRDENSEIDSSHEITFDAKAHIRQLEHSFHFFMLTYINV